MVHQCTCTIPTSGAGLYDVTDEVRRRLAESKIRSGLASVFCQHTSCSLVLMENASPAAHRDLQHFLDRLVPADAYEHDEEGPDDMPSHIKMALTRSSETIPVVRGELMLGTWQGIYLWEHRARAHRRNLAITIVGDE